MDLPDRIFFVGAHCDDVELFAGGLLARACRAGARVGLAVFSDHRGVLDETHARRARDELAANVEMLRASCPALELHGPAAEGDWMPACRGHFDAERERIYALFESLRDRYDLVVTHASSDTNQDHARVAIEAQRALKAHATVLGGEHPNNDVGAFRAQVYVSLDERDVRDKSALVARYASQARDGRPYLDPALVDSLARVRGSQIRTAWAEAYEVLGRVIVRA